MVKRLKFLAVAFGNAKNAWGVIVSAAKPHNLRKFFAAQQSKLISFVSVLVFLAIWETAANSGMIKVILISSPSRIFKAAIWLFNNGFWYDIWVSSTELGLGLFTAILVGIPAGICLGWYSKLRAAFDPFISALYATPRVALLPLLILWFGIGIESKVAVVFLGGIFPILVNTLTGVRTLDPLLLKCARSFSASDRQILTTLALPSSVPFIIAGVRLAVGRGLVGIVVGELIASKAGVGHMMSIAGATFQTDKLFVGIILLASTGYVLTESIKLVERYFERWRPERQE
ncbi:MAG: ABC transporter permease [Cyanobacteria bacterium P01_H01_bin.15]